MHSKTAITDLLALAVELCGRPLPPKNDGDELTMRASELAATGVGLAELANVLLVGLRSNSYKAQKQALERAREIATECYPLSEIEIDVDLGGDNAHRAPSAGYNEAVDLLEQPCPRLVVIE